MFQRRALEILVLMLCCVCGYWLYIRFSDSSMHETYRLSLGNLYNYIIFILAMVMMYMSMHHSMLCIYDHIKNKQKQKSIDLRRQNLLLDEVERQNRTGDTDNPLSQTLQQIMITEALTPRSKRKHMGGTEVGTDLATVAQTLHRTLTPKAKRKEKDVVDLSKFNTMPRALPNPVPLPAKPPQYQNLALFNNPVPLSPSNLAFNAAKIQPEYQQIDTVDGNKFANRVKKLLPELHTLKSKQMPKQGHNNPNMNSDNTF